MRSCPTLLRNRCFLAACGLLGAGSAHADIAGFANGAGWTATGSSLPAPTFTATSATLTNTGIENYAGSVFFNTAHAVGLGFSAQFTYQQTSTANPSGPGDGIAFVLQNSASGAAALGFGGGSVGYEGIVSSLAVVLDLNQGAPRQNTTGLGFGGSYNDNAGFACAPVSLESGHQIRVVLNYNATTGVLSQTLTDLTTSAVFSHNYPGINLAALLGGNNAWVGFTGGTGQNDDTQVISNFTLTAAAAQQIVNWNVPAPSNGGWFSPGNWTPSGVPTATDIVNIATGGTCTNGGGTGSAAILNVRGGSTLDMLGTLACGGQIRVGDLGGAGVLTVRNSGIVNASNLLLNADGSSPGTLRIGGGFSPGVVNAPVGGGGSAQVEFNHDSSGYSFAQPLTGSLGVTHQAGTTTLSSPGSNYTGSTVINGGTLRITNNASFNSNIQVGSGGALVLDIADDVRLNGALSGAGPVMVAGSTRTARVAGNNGGYTGAFSLPGGTRGMMWSGATAGSSAADWDLNGQFAFIETTGAATVRLGSLAGTNAATQLAAFGGSGLKTFEIGARGTNTSFAGAIKDISTFGGGGTGTVALAKVGTGTLTLSNVNTYTGGTTVSAGRLHITGAIPNTTVANGATLSGTGAVNGGMTIQPGGTLSPGANPGTLTCTGPVALNGTLQVDITGAAPGAGYDQLVQTSGTLTLGAAANLSFGTLSGTFTASDRLFIVNNTGSGALSGTFSGLPSGGATGTSVPALNGFGGFAQWRIYYGANQATNGLTGGNDIALAPVCSSDFNQSGSVSVQDIFDFLTAFFANDPRADFNRSGAISIQDIFDFLAAFFAGCT